MEHQRVHSKAKILLSFQKFVSHANSILKMRRKYHFLYLPSSSSLSCWTLKVKILNVEKQTRRCLTVCGLLFIFIYCFYLLKAHFCYSVSFRQYRLVEFTDFAFFETSYLVGNLYLNRIKYWSN